jgi:hypothetical protein
MSANVRVLAQTDPLANRLRAFGDDLKRAKTLVADLERVLKLLDGNAELLRNDGVAMTYTLGQIGDAAAACRRDLAKTNPRTFQMPTGDTHD